MSQSIADDAVQFFVYYPQEIAPNDQKPIYIYISKKITAEDIIQLAENPPEKPLYDPVALQTAYEKYSRAPHVMVTMRLDGFEILPLACMGAFSEEDLHPYEFQVMPQSAPLDRLTVGAATIELDGVIVADIPISIYVTEHIEHSKAVVAATKPYHHVFCSFSHLDTFIMERIERVSQLLGLDYLREITVLRSKQGQNELLNLIDHADVFQLFWSQNAAQSEAVEKEWRYAHQLAHQNFIRPVYWTFPMMPLPQELATLESIYRSDLWIELKYIQMPLDALDMSQRDLIRWKRSGLVTVGQVVDFLERIENGKFEPIHISRHIITDVERMFGRLEAIGAWPPPHRR